MVTVPIAATMLAATTTSAQERKPGGFPPNGLETHHLSHACSTRSRRGGCPHGRVVDHAARERPVPTVGEHLYVKLFQGSTLGLKVPLTPIPGVHRHLSL